MSSFQNFAHLQIQNNDLQYIAIFNRHYIMSLLLGYLKLKIDIYSN